MRRRIIKGRIHSREDRSLLVDSTSVVLFCGRGEVLQPVIARVYDIGVGIKISITGKIVLTFDSPGYQYIWAQF